MGRTGGTTYAKNVHLKELDIIWGGPVWPELSKQGKEWQGKIKSIQDIEYVGHSKRTGFYSSDN